MKNKILILSNSLTETTELAERLARQIYPGLVIALNGDLGAGKTTFVKALVRASGTPAVVTSPTFTLLNIYSGPPKIYHFDFYRLNNLEEIENIGGEELIPPTDGVAIIEWAEKIPEILPDKYLKLGLSYVSENSRQFEIENIGTAIKLEEIKKQ